MTASKPTDLTSAHGQPEPERLGLSATQLLASGLAAMSATVAASFFGVAGTVIGAALGSVITVIGNAVYGYSLRRTQRRVRRTLDVAVAHRFSADPARVIAHTAEAVEAPAEAGGARRWLPHPKRLALAAAGLFAAVLAVTTAFEFASGQPLSSTVTGKHGSGVSIVGGTAKKASPSPTRSSTPSAPSSAASDSPASPTVTVTVTPSDSATPSESSAAPSSPASSTPSPGATPTDSATPAS